jgi:hypothetical protein
MSAKRDSRCTSGQVHFILLPELSLVLPSNHQFSTIAGHEEGKAEQSAIVEFARGLDMYQWSNYIIEWANVVGKKSKSRAPLLVLLQKL